MEKNKRVVITGIGVAANNGIGKDDFYKNCVDGMSGIRKCTLFSTEKLMSDFFGEIPKKLPDSTVIPTGETRLKAIMRMALYEMMDDSGLDKESIKEYDVDAWLCFGTLLATVDGMTKYLDKTVSDGMPLVGYLEHVNDYLPWMRNLLGIQGESFVSSAACAAGTTAAGMAFDFIKHGFCKICVVGGADALTKTSAYGFHSLKSLSPMGCSPYDENRDGITIGEGAAFFIFEELNAAIARGVHIYGEVTGYGLANDAYHATSPDPEGFGLLHAMSEAVSESGITNEAIQHINGHGTGTLVNDSMEIEAINKMFSKNNPSVTSTKSVIGHCMGGAGALEIAAELLALENQIYLPLPNLKTPIKESSENMLDRVYKKRSAEYILSNSLAFAGNVASLVIKRYDE